MSDRNHHPADQQRVEREAAQWLVLRDRGLSPSEQDEYLQWLRLDPSHGEALGRHEATLRRMMRLGDWQPALSEEPNPDLFAPRGRLSWRGMAASLGVVAALVVGGAWWWPEASDPTIPANSFLRVNERQALPDGSLVELKDGSRIAVEFSAAERRVRLTGGEAHFTVAKNPSRPFVVVTGGVAVRAVGTAFNVRLDTTTVDVLVTEGRVMVEKRDPVRHDNVHAGKNANRGASRDGRADEVESNWGSAAPGHASEMPLIAGQRALVALAATLREVQVTQLGPQEIKDMLAWQSPRLQFFETPLAVAIAQFNQRSDARPHSRLVLDDPALGALPIGGTFRVDNVEGFVRLLEVTLDLRAEPRGGNELVLKRAHSKTDGR